eukprot:7281476-Pyramimonas_sp.AAC.1
MFVRGDLGAGDFAVRLAHALIHSAPGMALQLDRDLSAFLGRLAEETKVSAGARLPKAEWMTRKAMFMQGGRKCGAN